jgi:hypothetical protein
VISATLGHLVDIRKQSVFEEAEEKLIGALALTESSIKVFLDVDWNGQPAAATRQGIMRMLAC